VKKQGPTFINGGGKTCKELWKKNLLDPNCGEKHIEDRNV